MRTRAAVLSASGIAGPYAQTRPLQVEEVTLDPPGAGEVLVRITAASICHSDLSVVTGSRPRPLPMALGHEATGVIEEVSVVAALLARETKGKTFEDIDADYGASVTR